jgi:hypothetical protein
MADEPGSDWWTDYWVDQWQRGVLFLDVLRERGNEAVAQREKVAPNVLQFETELLHDGRLLERPVNYVLVRIVPPEGTVIDPAKPPFVVVDPRAGHGPGIGGMKQESEIGVALAAGHACYFVGFLPDPVEGQTIEDVCRAEALFIADVAARHPEADGKPVIVANCQAGWQTMIMAALNPDLTGPILLAGSPLSYWAGTRGRAPMRYTGGLLGGTWMTALAGDLGGGLFDGASLVANFERLDPANTLWTKPHNLYAKVDTEGPRFLDFETWWDNPVVLNAGEMQWIADNLFVGDKLTSGALRASDGARIDLRNIKAPIIAFCSWGDDITPPPQALGWITDLYDHEREIVAAGQTIVYALHQSIGHLGIFVSGKVAGKEHAEFASCMGMVELAPPGLYEAVITPLDPDAPNAALVDGGYLFRLEPRTVADIAALVGEDADDERCFAAAARVSETNLALYRTVAQPWVQAMTTPFAAQAMRWAHPNRLRFTAFSDRNPLMQGVAALAPTVRENRRPVADDNPLLALQRTTSEAITAGLQSWGALRDAMAEQLFFAAYGSPVVQAAAGLGPDDAAKAPHVERDLVREADQAQLRADLEDQFEAGGPLEACLRALVYVRLPDGGGADERAFNLLRGLRAGQPAGRKRTVAELKAALKSQFLLVTLDAERAVQAIPHLLPDDAAERSAMLETLRAVVDAPGPLSLEGRRRMRYVETLFGGAPTEPASPEGQRA